MIRGQINPRTGEKEHRHRIARKEDRNRARTVYNRERLKRINGPVVAKAAYTELCRMSTNPNNSLCLHPRRRREAT